MSSYIKSYIIVDETFTNLDLLKKYIFLIIHENVELSKVNNKVIKVSELDKSLFIKLCVSVNTIKNDLNLEQLLIVEVPFYKESLLLVLHSNNSGYLSLYELLLEEYKDDSLDLEFVKDVFKNVNKYIFDTAKAYIDLEESVQYTSEFLFTHRNTINYRISRFSQLSDINLKNGKNILLTRFLIYLYEKYDLGSENDI